jgi:hypothetical protein
VRVYHQTFNLPTLITNCSNNYGCYQFPEKLIPVMVLNAVAGRDLPVYDRLQDGIYQPGGRPCHLRANGEEQLRRISSENDGESRLRSPL